MSRQELTNELIEATEKLIGQDLLKADVAIGMGCFITVKTEESMAILSKAWGNVSNVTVTKIYKEVDVFNDDGKLIDIVNGEFVGYLMFADIREV